MIIDMGKGLAISILAFFISTVPIASGFGAGPVRSKSPKVRSMRTVAPVWTSNRTVTARKTPLRDGFVLTGVDGKLTGTDSNDIRFQDSNEGSQSQYIGFGLPNRWFFEFDSDISDDKAVVKAGTGLELLPSSTLEKMTADVEKRAAASPVRSKSPKTTAVPSVQTSNGASYKLWGRVTKYKGRNFIFPIYFLPLSETKRSPPSTSQEPREKTGPTLNDPNDALTIPKEILEKLKTRKILRPEQLKKGLELEQDSILADRTGFISSCVMRDAYRVKGKRKEEKGRTQWEFVFDALGRNVQQIILRLLPCQALESAEQEQSTEADTLRFKIAGILTKYKGNHYLLLERTTRVYSHGNFGK